MSKSKIVFPLIVLILSLVSCDDSNSELSDDNFDDNIDNKLIINQGNFLPIFKSLVDADEEEANILYSPYSVDAVLSMVMSGSGGNSQAALMKYFNLDTEDELNSFYNSQLAKKKIISTSTDTTTITINNLCAYDDSRVALNSDFVDNLESYWDCELLAEDFDQATQSKNNINNWVKDHTNGKIEQIIESIESGDLFFLINTIYFKSNWKVPFAEEGTSKRPFQTENGEIEVDMMYSDSRFLHFDNEKITAVGLDYADNENVMIAVMPKNTLKLDFDALSLDSIINNLVSRRISLTIPKFTSSYSSKLNEPLIDNGFGDVFTSNSYTKMGSSLIGGALEPTKLVQKVVFQIDESGSEGAAATSIGIGVTSAPPPVAFDRPFLFVLYNRTTKAMLFSGYVTNPSLSD